MSVDRVHAAYDVTGAALMTATMLPGIHAHTGLSPLSAVLLLWAAGKAVLAVRRSRGTEAGLLVCAGEVAMAGAMALMVL